MFSWHFFLIVKIFYSSYQEKGSFDVIHFSLIFNLLKFDKTDWYEQKILYPVNTIS